MRALRAPASRELFGITDATRYPSLPQYVHALVCTSGSATKVVLALLDALAATSCRFACHGDSDWPGTALANRIIRPCGAQPWRMGADAYELLAARSQTEGIPQLPLDGQPVNAAWDPGLALAMTALGVALHEEVTLDLLVDHLSGRPCEVSCPETRPAT